MKRVSLTWGLLSFCVWSGLGIGMGAAGADPAPGPTEWSDWDKYRDSVVHPATIIKPQDLLRAKANIHRY